MALFSGSIVIVHALSVSSVDASFVDVNYKSYCNFKLILALVSVTVISMTEAFIVS